MFEMHLICGITDGWQGCQPPLAKLNVKNGPLPSLYFGIYYCFGSVATVGIGELSPSKFKYETL